MLNYIIRRILLMIPTVLGITLLVFLVMAMAPGGVAGALLSAQGNMRPEERRLRMEYLNRRYGLDKPIMVQYGRWLNRVSPIGFRTYTDDDPKVRDAAARARQAGEGVKPSVRAGELDFRHPTIKWPDLGDSFLRNRPVIEIVKEALPITLLLNLTTIPIAYAIAVTAGIYAARHRGKLFDVTSGTVFLGLWSIPTIWAGVMMIGFLANKDYLGAFPTGGLHDTAAENMAFLPHIVAGHFQRGWLLDSLWHLALPVACLTYGEFAFLSKLMRSSMLENLSADFARTARAKGLSENAVLFRHVLSNSILPLITMAAATVPTLLGGSVVVEQIFSINGMGRLMIEAIFQREQEIVLSVTLVVSIVTVVSLLIADICYALADPRITYD
ncbi:MAG TPA: ABC transporter permease [Tepidisphaeraceae bacterium]|jgi:ABC-type dipeptide/oligopeptide/nickel transport system permease component